MKIQTIQCKTRILQSRDIAQLETRKPTRGLDDFGGLVNHKTDKAFRPCVLPVSWQGQ